MPKLGDVIIETCTHDATPHIGIVYNINYDSWGHQRGVMIEWSSDTKPYSYSIEHGYHGVNIHNCRARFTVIRDGVIIK